MEEVLGLADMAVSQLARFNQGPGIQQHQVSPMPQYPQSPAPTRFDMDLSDDEFVSGRQVKQILQHYGNQANQGDPVARQLAASSNVMTIQQVEADAFRRWGPELHAMIAQVPAEMRTVDNLQHIVQLVRGRHVQELVDEQARQQAVRLAEEQVATIRSGTGGSPTSPQQQQIDLTSSELPEDWRKLAEKNGLTMDAVREFCQATGETVESYFASVKKHGKGAIISG